MPALVVPNSFSAATRIRSALVNANFNAIATFLNSTKLDSSNLQSNAVVEATITDGAVTAGKIAAASVASTKLITSVVAKTTTYTATSADDIILVSAAADWTLSLPTAVGISGKEYTIIRTDNDLSHKVTLDPSGSETIRGLTTVTLNTAYESWTIISDGSNWQVREHFCATPWTAYTPTFSAGFGTAASVNFYWRRVNDGVEIRGTWTNGTVTNATPTISLPSGVTASAAMGSLAVLGTSWTQATTSSGYTNVAQVLSAASDTTMSFSTPASITLAKLTDATQAFGNAGVCSLTAQVPVGVWYP